MTARDDWFREASGMAHSLATDAAMLEATAESINHYQVKAGVYHDAPDEKAACEVVLRRLTHQLATELSSHRRALFAQHAALEGEWFRPVRERDAQSAHKKGGRR